MERAVGKNEKLESFKLEGAKRSRREPSEVGKLLLKLENFVGLGNLTLALIWKL